MKKIILSVAVVTLASITLSSCSSMQSHQAAGNNSKNTHSIVCTSLNRNSNNDACLMKAKKLCSNGYSVIENESHIIEYADSGDGFYMPPREILAIQCKPA